MPATVTPASPTAAVAPATDPVLKKLIQDLTVELMSLRTAHADSLLQINTLKSQVAAGASKAVDLGSNAPIPVYKPLEMSPEAFILELEEYLTYRNAPQTAWLATLSRIFEKNSDLRNWWRESRNSCVDWTSFRVAFVHYNQSGQSEDLMAQQLFAMKQQFSDAFETYCWNVNSIYTKGDPLVTKTKIIQRIINSCLTDVSVVLKQHSYKTLIDLIIKGKEVIMDLNKSRAVRKLPLLRARECDPIHKAVPYNAPYSGPSNFIPRPPQSSQVGKESGSGENRDTKSSSSTPKPQTAPGELYCTYCRKTKHLKEDCYKLKRKNEYAAKMSASASGN